MRGLYLRAIFQTVLLVAATTGGLPCYSCPDEPPSTQIVSPEGFKPYYNSAPDGGYFVDDAGVLQVKDGVPVPLPSEQCAEACSATDIDSCQLEAGDAGAVVACMRGTRPGDCPGGRRTRGVGLGRVSASTAVGVYFGACAALEAASVRSFRRLRRELRERGAPRSLLRGCSRAARDESRHARALGSLTRREGGRVAPTEEAPRSPRSLEALAIENAVEGCVFETFGALLALWQATHAVDPMVRGSMQRLARDEARHAALAWTMAEWLESRLAPAARTRVREARSSARRRLLEQLADAPPTALFEQGLLPSAGEGRDLAERLAAALPA